MAINDMKKNYLLGFLILFACYSCSKNNRINTVIDPDSINIKIGRKTKEQKKNEHLKDITFEIENLYFKMIAVSNGTFLMGANEEDYWALDIERPQHKVTLSDFYIGETEVTQELWEAIMGNNPSYSIKGGDYPVDNISWDDCQEFIRKLNALAAENLPNGRRFRLPTEAEWEYAAKGGNKSKRYRYSGDNICRNVAWCNSNSYTDYSLTLHPHKVKTKKANELGIYDMSGNVEEWCSDWWGNYNTQKVINPTGPSDGSYHVYRGGSVADDERYLHITFRNLLTTRFDYNSYSYIGLRLAL